MIILKTNSIRRVKCGKQQGCCCSIQDGGSGSIKKTALEGEHKLSMTMKERTFEEHPASPDDRTEGSELQSEDKGTKGKMNIIQKEELLNI